MKPGILPGGDRSVVVAIVDNAIDVTHPDLAAKVVYKWDMANSDSNPGPPNSDEIWQHGTHCSGIACAETDNGIGVASIGYNCGLMAIRTAPNFNGGFMEFGYEGIEWAAIHGAKVISCSWGSTFSFTGKLLLTMPMIFMMQ